MKRYYITPKATEAKRMLRANILTGSVITPDAGPNFSGDNTGIKAGASVIPAGAEAGARKRVNID